MSKIILNIKIIFYKIFALQCTYCHFSKYPKARNHLTFPKDTSNCNKDKMSEQLVRIEYPMINPRIHGQLSYRNEYSTNMIIR